MKKISIMLLILIIFTNVNIIHATDSVDKIKVDISSNLEIIDTMNEEISSKEEIIEAKKEKIKVIEMSVKEQKKVIIPNLISMQKLHNNNSLLEFAFSFNKENIILQEHNNESLLLVSGTDFNKIISDLKDLEAQKSQLEKEITLLKQDINAQQSEVDKLNKKLEVLAPAEIVDAPNVSGSHTDWMNEAGISSDDYKYVNYIVSQESGWNYKAENAYSGAYGLCQALPGSKMNSAGSDWATNPVTQLKWCDGYATGRYGSWEEAYNFWISNHWW